MCQEENFIPTKIKFCKQAIGSYYSHPEFDKFFEEIGIPVEKGERFSFTPPNITSADIENVVKAAEKYGLEISI